MEQGELPPEISFCVTFKLDVDWAKQALMKAKHFEKLGCVDSRDQSLCAIVPVSPSTTPCSLSRPLLNVTCPLTGGWS